MNTCQTSIKPVYYYSVAVAHILSLPDKHESITLCSRRTKQRGESQVDELASQIRIICRYYGNYYNILLVSIVN